MRPGARRLVACAALAGVAGLAAACRALIGSLDECSTDADCVSHGQNLVCANQLCVASPPLDARCTVVGNAGGGPPIVVGALLPLTTIDGGGDPRGVFRQHAIQAAFEQLNPPVREGIRQRPLELIVCNNASDPDQGAALAGVLIARGAVAIISAGSAETLSESNVTLPAKVLLVSSSATSPELTDLPASPDGVRLLWRTAPSDAFQGKVISDELSGEGGGPLPKVGVFELDDPYGQGLYGAFAPAYRGTQQAWLYERNGNVSSAVTSATAFAPSIVVNIAFPDDAVVIVNAYTPGPGPSNWFFTDSAKSPALLTGLTNPRALEGARGTTPSTASPDAAAYAWFSQQFSQEFNEDPTSVSFVANTFDAAMLIALAAYWATDPSRTLDGTHLALGLGQLADNSGLHVPLDPPNFNTAISELAAGRAIHVEGASGSLDFDAATGEAPGNIDIWQVVDGGFVTIKTVAP